MAAKCGLLGFQEWWRVCLDAQGQTLKALLRWQGRRTERMALYISALLFLGIAATGDFLIDYCETKNQLKEHDH